MSSGLVNIKFVTNHLKVKESWLRMAIFQKKIPFIKVGRLIRFDLAEIESWLQKNSVK
jgi:excisionase family DNA binding protein